MIYLTIKGQKLTLSQDTTVEQTIDYLEVKATFSPEWEGLSKFVHFTQGETSYVIEMTDDAIAKDCHLNLAKGEWIVAVHGNEIDGETVTERITTTVAQLYVKQTGALDGEPLPITPASVGEQILAKAANALNVANASAETSANALEKANQAEEDSSEALSKATQTESDLASEVTRAKAREDEIEAKIPSHDNFATKDELNAETTRAKGVEANKVDKVTGKSLISDTEIERLANVHNYDDTGIQKEISDEVTRAKARENEIEAKIPSHDNFATKDELETETTRAEGVEDKKVDKEDGKSLISSTDLAQISTNKEDIEDLQDDKVDKEDGKGLSTNDFTDTYKSNIETNNKKVSNVQADWNATEGEAVILNKPTDLGKVDDVKVNGTSVVSNKVANIEMYTKSELYTKTEIDEKLETIMVSVDIVGTLGGKPVGNTIKVSVGSDVQQTKAYNGSPVTFELQKGVTYTFTATDIDTFYDCVVQTIAITTSISVTLSMTEIGDTDSWGGINDIIDHQKGSTYFNVGGTFESNIWKDTVSGTSYNYDLRANDFQDVELEDGTTRKDAMILQGVWAHPFGVQFSHQRAFLQCPNGLSAGTYYFTIESSWGSNVSAGDIVCFTLTKAVPTGGRLAGCYGAPDQAKSNWRVYSFDAYGINILETVTPTFEASGTSLGTQKLNARNGNLNSTQEMAYGCNRWATSAIRQYLNSDKLKNNWWTQQDGWDIRPDELSSRDGFLCGLDSELLKVIKTIKVTTYKNTTTYDGTADITYDKVILPALEQMYINPQIAGEGSQQQYYVDLNGTTTKYAQWGTYEALKTYAVENHTSAQYVRLRSANLGNAINSWLVYSSGYVNSSIASSSYRFAPLVFI